MDGFGARFEYIDRMCHTHFAQSSNERTNERTKAHGNYDYILWTRFGIWWVYDGTCCPVHRTQQHKTHSNFISEKRALGFFFLFLSVVCLRCVLSFYLPLSFSPLPFAHARHRFMLPRLCHFRCVFVVVKNAFLDYVAPCSMLIFVLLLPFLRCLEQHGNSRENIIENIKWTKLRNKIK